MPHQVWQLDHWSDIDNRCALNLYEQEGGEQIFIMTSPIY